MKKWFDIYILKSLLIANCLIINYFYIEILHIKDIEIL